MESCGDSWGGDSPSDGVRPHHCDNVKKAHLVNIANLEIGRLKFLRQELFAYASAEVTWVELNLDERQALLDVFVRGKLNGETNEWEEKQSPNYYNIWITHQLIYGSGSGNGAYSGWNCSIPCDKCDADHGTCQFDGSCECEPGWYGAACDRRCDCFRLDCSASADRQACEAAGQGGLKSARSDSGYEIRAFGTCMRDGACLCHPDDTGLMYNGKDCFTPCEPCSHGVCQLDGSCKCNSGWSGPACDTKNHTECLPAITCTAHAKQTALVSASMGTPVSTVPSHARHATMELVRLTVPASAASDGRVRTAPSAWALRSLRQTSRSAMKVGRHIITAVSELGSTCPRTTIRRALRGSRPRTLHTKPAR